MDMVQLKYFAAVAEAGHLTNAAKKLNVAQPALSVSIARLEKEVGVPLFDRKGRNIYLNRCGEIYLDHVEHALDIMKKAQQEVDMYCGKLEDVLNLGIVSKPFAWKMLMKFREQYPNSRIRQCEIMPDSVEEELRSGNVDYVIASRYTMAPGLMGEIFRSEPIMLAVPVDHPFANREWVRLSEAKDETFICLPKEYEYRTIVEEMCQNSGFTPNIGTECFHCHMAAMVAGGNGVALMTEDRAAQNANNKQMKFIPIRDPVYTRNHYIVWQAGHRFNKMSREFRKYLRTVFEDSDEIGCNGCH